MVTIYYFHLYATYIRTNVYNYKDGMLQLVNKAAIAAWVIAIVTPVVAVAAWVECTILPGS